MFSSITQGSRRARSGLSRMRGVVALVFAAAAAAVFAPANPAHAVTMWIQIGNNWTHQCIQVNGAAVSQQGCVTGASGQLFEVAPTRFEGIWQLYELRVYQNPSECLDLPNYAADPAGSVVGVYTCNSKPGLDNQEWYSSQVSSDSNGPTYEIQNYASQGLCLDVAGWASNGSDQNSGQKLTIYPCHNSSWANGGWDDHLWYLGM
jgi:hypothetical protein